MFNRLKLSATQLAERLHGLRLCWAARLVDRAGQASWDGDACRSGFATLPPESLQEQPVVVLLLKGVLISWSLAMDERSGHEDLCGSGHRSVIPYVHERMELYCAQACLA
jgi:hypothetical protein